MEHSVKSLTTQNNNGRNETGNDRGNELTHKINRNQVNKMRTQIFVEKQNWLTQLAMKQSNLFL